MSTAQFSVNWHVVSELKFRLRGHTEIHRHRYGDTIWYVLHDKVIGQCHRFSIEAYQIIGMMDGKRSLDDIWELACQRLGDDMPSQDEIITLLSNLFQANVLQSDKLPDIDQLHMRHSAQEKKRFWQKVKSPLGIRVPLLDPDRFIEATMPLVKPLFGPLGICLWLLTVIYALSLVGIHWQGLTSNMSDQILSLENVLVTLLVYPVLKTIHELGHAYAIKRWGGEVHEVGLMFLVFVPVPYVDASAASAFANKYQRMVVGAAGIIVEVFLAALAMVVWSLVEPGALRSVAYNVMLIAGVSTVLFNGNPLLKFDAYYVFADYLEIPNLSTRANQYFFYFCKRYLFGVTGLTSVATSNREGKWMLAYAIAAYVYRIFVMFAIALFVTTKYLFVGGLLALWVLSSTIFLPLLKMLWAPFVDAQLRNRRRQVFITGGGIAIVLVVLVAIIPFPYETQVEGVLVAADNSQLRPVVSGFVKQVLAENGAKVKKGDLLLQLQDPSLDAQVALLLAQVGEAEARYQAQLNDRTASEINRELLKLRKREYARTQERHDALQIYSPVDGEFILDNASNLSGRYLARGDLIGYVVDFDKLPATALVREDEIDAVRNNTIGVQIRLVSNLNQVFAARVQRIVPASSKDMPSEVLATRAGGKISLDPNQNEHLRAFRPYYHLLLELKGVPRRSLNERVYVLFQHQDEPLVHRWVRALRRVFLRQLDV
jgi:putative peptide zinc metalloprotease protein